MIINYNKLIVINKKNTKKYKKNTKIKYKR